MQQSNKDNKNNSKTQTDNNNQLLFVITIIITTRIIKIKIVIIIVITKLIVVVMMIILVIMIILTSACFDEASKTQSTQCRGSFSSISSLSGDHPTVDQRTRNGILIIFPFLNGHPLGSFGSISGPVWAPKLRKRIVWVSCQSSNL